jgi:DNA polymerase-3 subunit epsilon
MREIILDIETSGLDYKEGHRVIEIGCIELNRKEVGSHFHRYINPLKTLTEENMNIHGITNEFLEDKPLFEDVADDFLSFIQDSFIIAHNANFDVGFLNHELEKISKPTIDKDRVVDTVVIARNRFPGQQVNLDALVKKLKVNSLIDREFHGALKDAKILTDVYLELQGVNQMGLQLDEGKSEDLNLSGELNLKTIVLTKEETEAHKEFIRKNIPNSNWAKTDKTYEQ